MRRKAFTLVELLVVIAIIGILVALLLPAVQAAREAARRMQCTSQLKNLVLATHNYHDTYKAFPAMQGGTGSIHSGGQRNRLAGFASLLPFYEQQALYDEIMTANDGPWGTVPRWQINIAILICPSDGAEQAPHGTTLGRRSYVFCAGDNFAAGAVSPAERNDQALAAQQRPIVNRGIFGRNTYSRMGDITDGTSNTIALSERVGPSTTRAKGMVAVDASAEPTTYSPLSCRPYWGGSRYIDSAAMFTQDTSPGFRWGDGYPFFSGMTTILPPNTASCLIGTPDWAAGGGHAGPGVWTASSWHPGGVNCAMADGSVRFVSDTVNAGDLSVVAPAGTTNVRSPYGVWGAMGTKAGREAVSL